MMNAKVHGLDSVAFVWQLGVTVQSKIHAIAIEANGNKQKRNFEIIFHFDGFVSFFYFDLIFLLIRFVLKL